MTVPEVETIWLLFGVLVLSRLTSNVPFKLALLATVNVPAVMVPPGATMDPGEATRLPLRLPFPVKV